jgi:hypothetical protein
MLFRAIDVCPFRSNYLKIDCFVAEVNTEFIAKELLAMTRQAQYIASDKRSNLNLSNHHITGEMPAVCMPKRYLL